MQKAAISIIVFFALLTGNAWAGWTQFGTISNLRIYKGYVVIASLSSMTPEEAVCGDAPIKRQFAMYLSDEYLKATYTTLLMAQISGTQVSVYPNGACNGNRIMINGAYLGN